MMARRRLAILGASGHGKVVAEIALLTGWREVVFFDDAWPALSGVGPWGVIGDSRCLIESAGLYDGVAVAIGDNRIRLEKLMFFETMGVEPVTLIHPSAVKSGHASVGKGTVLCAGAVINPFATIGSGCIINTGATVDHDCMIADGVHVSPGTHLGGGVCVETASWIGLGACVKQSIHIGEASIVGMGAVVIRDVSAGTTVVGNPAHEIGT